MTAEIDTFEEEFVPSGRGWLLFALLVIAFVCCCGLSLLLPYSRYVQYQQFTGDDLMFRSRWIYERIHYDKTPIDIAIIGSSRAEKGLSPSYLEKELSTELGRPIHAVNFALLMEGRSMQYVIAKELIENRPETRIILLSVVERDDLDHPAFRYLADASDVIESPLLINRYYLQNVAVLPYRQLNLFAQTLFPTWFGVSTSFRQDYWGTQFDPTYSFRAPSGKIADAYHVMPPDELAAGSAQILRDQGGPWHPHSRWDTLNNPLEQAFTGHLANDAKRHCIEIVMVYLPFYKSPPHNYNQAFYSRFGPLLDAQSLSGDPHDYMDEMHFNRYGVDKASPWLKDALQPYLDPLRNPQPCTK